VKGIRLFALLGTAAFALASACGGNSRPHGLSLGGSGDGGAAGGGGLADSGLLDGPPPPDASGLCGNQFVPVLIDRPNVYFVLDASGSMVETLPGSGGLTKYNAARVDIAEVLRTMGHRISYGAASFPLPGGPVTGCGAGAEIFPTTPGDPASYAASGVDGPVLKTFLQKTNAVAPGGGTSTSATLLALTPGLEALPGKTVVVLATDGAPNCNLTMSCGPNECQYNIEGYALPDGTPCQAPLNCCDNLIVQGGSYQCVDKDASVAAIAALKDAGIPSYVIGMPGSEAYVDVLDAMAVAGGTARPSEPLYYATTDTDALSAALKEIGIKIAISCDVQLDEQPPEPNLVNVYFDTSEVLYDPVDGWSWTSPTSISINGAACSQLKSGDVLQVQVTAGCPTKVK
jgi:hypothetical protein